jgi:glycosyltransferase involved in cell wall biosynthesis
MNTVSVVIPAFNSAKYIGEAIQSVLEQTLVSFEVLVVDDGSTDDTAEVVQRYPVQYFRQENAGPSAARNTGMTKAKGEFVAFLDSDDLWLPQKLAVQLEAFKRHPDAGFSFSTVWNFYAGKNAKVSTEPYAPAQLKGWLRARTNDNSEEVFGSVYELLLRKNCAELPAK